MRQLGQNQKLPLAKNRTTIGKFSLPKSMKHSTETGYIQYLNSGKYLHEKVTIVTDRFENLAIALYRKN